MRGCGEGSQSRSGDAAQVRGEAKGTAQLGRDPGEGQQLPHAALAGDRVVGASRDPQPLASTFRVLKAQGKGCRDPQTVSGSDQR